MATKTKTIGLNQYVGTDYVRMSDFNEDNRLIDEAIKQDRAKIDAFEGKIAGIELVDTKVKITDAKGHFTGDTLDKVLEELKGSFDSIETTAASTSYNDTTTQLGVANVQNAIEKLLEKIKASDEKIKALEAEVTGQATRLAGINSNLDATIGNPV